MEPPSKDGQQKPLQLCGDPTSGKPIEEWQGGHIAKYMGAIIHQLVI